MSSKRFARIAALAALSLPVLACAAFAQSPPPLSDPCIPVAMPPAAIPHLRAALAAHEPIVIVAIGSSSTQSWRSSDPAHSYPAVLQAALSRALPTAHIAVINRGVGGEDAPEEVARMDTDVLAIRPQLVIWQVGSNSVLRSADPIVFKRLVSAGIERLHKAGADVIVMDNQQAPELLSKPEHLIMDQALAEVAAAKGASLFARSSLMEAWQRAGKPYGTFISSDGLHHNDLGYRCVAESLAGVITAGLGPDHAAK